jgi:hypothetical protein
MSELRCSSLGYDDECIDYTKAKSFEFMVKNDGSFRSYYHSVFGTKKIVLDVDNEKIELYDWNPNNYAGYRKITSPVSVYNPMLNRYIVGVLEVYMYEE